MRPPCRLVLDANTFRGLPVRRMKELSQAGFTLSISETALNEAWARSAENYRCGKWPRERARSFFLRGARNVAPYVDPAYPIAVAGGHAAERILMAIRGTTQMDSPSMQRANKLRLQWEHIISVGLTDEEWLAGGQLRLQSLNQLDQLVRFAAQPEAVGWGVPDGADPEWRALPDEKKMARRRDRARKTFGPELAERLDAFVCAVVWLLNESEHGRREIRKENDGPDLALTMHLGEGFILLTDDIPLVKMVDSCGTCQAPWVRRPHELDDLPAGVPWGPDALPQSKAFRRAV